MKIGKFSLLALIACQTLFLSGCTSMLWKNDRFGRCHSPANPANLRLSYSESARDVLVEYDEASEAAGPVQRRAYWLEHNAQRTKHEQKPRFVSVAKTRTLVPVSLLSQDPTNSPFSPLPGLYAIHSPDSRSFFLSMAEQQKPAAFNLPVYYAGSGQRAKQIMLTPFAVAVDATLVGGIFAVLAADKFAREFAVNKCLIRPSR